MSHLHRSLSTNEQGPPPLRHVGELAKVRQVAAAADKLRRERWRAEESQRIKEATVRSLEPEIQRIIQKGKADVQRLKAMHEVRPPESGLSLRHIQCSYLPFWTL